MGTPAENKSHVRTLQRRNDSPRQLGATTITTFTLEPTVRRLGSACWFEATPRLFETPDVCSHVLCLRTGTLALEDDSTQTCASVKVVLLRLQLVRTSSCVAPRLARQNSHVRQTKASIPSASERVPSSLRRPGWPNRQNQQLSQNGARGHTIRRPSP